MALRSAITAAGLQSAAAQAACEDAIDAKVADLTIPDPALVQTLCGYALASTFPALTKSARVQSSEGNPTNVIAGVNGQVIDVYGYQVLGSSDVTFSEGDAGAPGDLVALDAFSPGGHASMMSERGPIYTTSSGKGFVFTCSGVSPAYCRIFYRQHA